MCEASPGEGDRSPIKQGFPRLVLGLRESPDASFMREDGSTSSLEVRSRVQMYVEGVIALAWRYIQNRKSPRPRFCNLQHQMIRARGFSVIVKDRMLPQGVHLAGHECRWGILIIATARPQKSRFVKASMGDFVRRDCFLDRQRRLWRPGRSCLRGESNGVSYQSSRMLEWRSVLANRGRPTI